MVYGNKHARLDAVALYAADAGGGNLCATDQSASLQQHRSLLEEQTHWGAANEMSILVHAGHKCVSASYMLALLLPQPVTACVSLCLFNRSSTVIAALLLSLLNACLLGSQARCVNARCQSHQQGQA